MLKKVILIVSAIRYLLFRYNPDEPSNICPKEAGAGGQSPSVCRVIILCIFLLNYSLLSLVFAQEPAQDIAQGNPSQGNSIEIFQEKVQTQDLNLEAVEVIQPPLGPISQISLKPEPTPSSKKICISIKGTKDDLNLLSQKVSLKKAKTFKEAKTKGWKAQVLTKPESVDKIIKPVQSKELQDLEIKRKKQRQGFSQELEKRQARKAILQPFSKHKRQKSPLRLVTKHSSDLETLDNSETNPRILTLPAYLVFQAKQGQTEALTQSFKISNSGIGTLNYTLSKSANWLSLSKTSGSLTTQEDTITVALDPSGLTEANSPYIEDITITNIDVPLDSRKLRVRLSLFSQDVYSQTYTYDSNNNLTRRITADNQVIEYKYDRLNRLTNIYYPDAKQTSYEYDANANLIKMTDWQGETLYAYDELNYLRAVQFPGIKPIYYDYDKAGKLIKITYPTDEEVTYGYNDDNQLIKVIDKTGTTTYEYDPSKKTNNLIKKTLANGVYTEYVYDTAKRITNVRNKKSNNSLISSYYYTYDANNNIILTQESTPQATKTTTYTYDKLNRLIRADYSDNTFEAYTYDASGNRLTKTTQDGTISYEYDSDNRLIKAADTIFFYDKSGNLIKKLTSNQTFIYEYDYNNKLIRYSDGTNLVEFEYDGNGRRISKKLNGRITRYVSDINRPIMQVLLETDSNWNVQKKYVYGLDLISQEEF